MEGEKTFGYGPAVRCQACPLLPDRYWICTRDCQETASENELAKRAAERKHEGPTDEDIANGVSFIVDCPLGEVS